ncbi:hypothetical protein O181_038378 [Austropuccinia psidii MF-1]|uniref:RxLR-like protein n=1 Tax=Austropuccinia psidii MF-1 TaxID=1389203 RepID=A0A9Q3DBB1_9BASI|nr:hypothetical protein [Austropuccinia psidii MF-1]
MRLWCLGIVSALWYTVSIGAAFSSLTRQQTHTGAILFKESELPTFKQRVKRNQASLSFFNTARDYALVPLQKLGLVSSHASADSAAKEAPDLTKEALQGKTSSEKPVIAQVEEKTVSSKSNEMTSNPDGKPVTQETHLELNRLSKSSNSGTKNSKNSKKDTTQEHTPLNREDFLTRALKWFKNSTAVSELWTRLIKKIQSWFKDPGIWRKFGGKTKEGVTEQTTSPVSERKIDKVQPNQIATTSVVEPKAENENGSKIPQPKSSFSFKWWSPKPQPAASDKALSFLASSDPTSKTLQPIKSLERQKTIEAQTIESVLDLFSVKELAEILVSILPKAGFFWKLVGRFLRVSTVENILEQLRIAVTPKLEQALQNVKFRDILSQFIADVVIKIKSAQNSPRGKTYQRQI